ncbi:hypothetical protein H0H93_012120 [Arthromyces matolae]|nr:hypothetical protein H0H93_012120 [Arthromyces matolae]
MSEKFGMQTMESVPPMQHVISESRLPSVNHVNWPANVAESDYETEYFQSLHASEPFLHSSQMGMNDVQGFYVEKMATSPSRNSFHSSSTASSPYRSTFDHCMLGVDDYEGSYPSCDQPLSPSGSRSIHHAQPEEMQISRYSELSPNVAFFQSSLEEEARHKSSAHVLVRTSSRFGGSSRRHSKTMERPSPSSRSAESGDGRIPLPPPDLTPASVSSRPLRHGQKAILTIEPLPNNSRGLQA